MKLYHQQTDMELWHGDALEGLPCDVDTLIVDPPYSDRTHGGHDDGVNGHQGAGKDTASRRHLDYATWDKAQVVRAVNAWHPRCRGWFVVITDHILAPVWETWLKDAGRYVFAPLPFFSPGSRVRLAGDGPSSWTCWIVVARPRHDPYSKWGTLPGGYVCPPERMPIVGGKPKRLMRALVSDYSRPGDLVCDPCAGAGTTLYAALDLGRRAVGVEISEEHCRLAVEGRPLGTEQPTLFGGSEWPGQ